MAITLSIADFLDQHPESIELIDQIRQPWLIPIYDPSDHSCGYRKQVNLRKGLSILIDDYTLQDDLLVEVSRPASRELALSIELSFMVCGHNRQEQILSAHNFFAAHWYDRIGGEFLWRAGERVLKLDIHIDIALFESLVGQDSSALPAILRQTIQCPQPIKNYFLDIASTTPAMQSAIYQLLHCPYQGLTQWLFWESKVMELIALRLEQLQQQQQNVVKPGLHSDDIERIYYAREILLERLTNPPSLLELARLAGINDRKLRQGFHQIFNTTVFGCLTQYRLEKACYLLTEQQSVASVAAAVGYASPTAFSSTFQRQFGISPKRYQIAKRK